MIREKYKTRRNLVDPTMDQLGKQEEIDFWRRALAESMFADRLADRPLAANLIDLIKNGSGAGPDEATILDVGSGPLTTIGTLWDGKKVKVIATDTLGTEFAEMLSELKIEAPVVPISVEAEQLGTVFAKNSIDLIMCSNALDHCRDPFAAIDSMLEVLKPGCSIYIWSFENEGAKERYQGMHQWDLYEQRGDFILSGPNCEESMQQRLSGKAEVECKWLPTGPRHAGHIEVIIRKLRM